MFVPTFRSSTVTNPGISQTGARGPGAEEILGGQGIFMMPLYKYPMYVYIPFVERVYNRIHILNNVYRVQISYLCVKQSKFAQKIQTEEDTK